MGDTPCETANHAAMPQSCANDEHERCATCGGCYSCAAEATREPGERLAERVRAWAKQFPDASTEPQS